MKKVLLVNMPFGSIDRPALGISLLKPILENCGITCDLRNLTFPFAEFIGCDEYRWVAYDLPYVAFAGDWSFVRELYGDKYLLDNSYCQDILRDGWQLDEASVNRILRIRAMVSPFLDFCMALVPWEEYAVVGFTSTFEQNIASLCLARRIKEKYPDIAIIFGGANWECEMGQELHRTFPFVDFVCSGESENSLPDLVHLVLEEKATFKNCQSIPGIVFRHRDQTIHTGPPKLIKDMDSLPIPDFSDYFNELSQSTISASVVPVLLLETSRGCWWGSKSHCTFCGLNGGSLTYRSKSSDRALLELQYLVNQWRIEMIEVVDNILDMDYFKKFLPALAKLSRPVRIFYEVKANLSRKQVRILKEAGVYRIQPGIESLSNRVLKLMRKGTTALKNIQLLKHCKEYDIAADWNILYGFPGESQKDYDAVMKLLPAIRFLNPPNACGPVRLDRFSPYFNSPADFGLVNVRPLITYKYLYPLNQKQLEKIAYCFDFDYKADIDPTGFGEELIEYVKSWQATYEKGKLISIDRPDEKLILIDTRSNAIRKEVVLSGMERLAYKYCDHVRSSQRVTKYLHQCFPQYDFTEQQVIGFLDSLVNNMLMVKEGHNYLSLAISIRPVDAISTGSFNSTTDSGKLGFQRQTANEFPADARV